MNEVDSTTLEQLDLILNNLGQVCKVQCENIRSTTVRNPERALPHIWVRLDLEYGSSEAVEHSMKQRVANFTSLTEDARKRYFYLFELAAEVESLKGDDYHGSAFANFDSSTGINDFVRKLPKRFLGQQLARLRNGPRLIMDNYPQKPTAHHPQQRKPVQRSDVSVHKQPLPRINGDLNLTRTFHTFVVPFMVEISLSEIAKNFEKKTY